MFNSSIVNVGLTLLHWNSISNMCTFQSKHTNINNSSLINIILAPKENISWWSMHSSWKHPFDTSLQISTFPQSHFSFYFLFNTHLQPTIYWPIGSGFNHHVWFYTGATPWGCLSMEDCKIMRVLGMPLNHIFAPVKLSNDCTQLPIWTKKRKSHKP